MINFRLILTKVSMNFDVFTDKLWRTKISLKHWSISASQWFLLLDFSSTERSIKSTTENSLELIPSHKNISFRQNTFCNVNPFLLTTLRCNWISGIQNSLRTLWTLFITETISKIDMILFTRPTTVEKLMPRIWSLWKKSFCHEFLSFKRLLEKISGFNEWKVSKSFSNKAFFLFRFQFSTCAWYERRKNDGNNFVSSLVTRHYSIASHNLLS